MWWAPNQGFGWWMIFGGIWMIVFWGVIIGLVVWGIRAVTDRRDRPSLESSPLEIAQRRYARGEISKEEFNDIKATLGR
jgi:putative membrane protein